MAQGQKGQKHKQKHKLQRGEDFVSNETLL